MQIQTCFVRQNTDSGMVSFLSPFSMRDSSMFMELVSSAHITASIMLSPERLSSFKASVV